MELKFFKMKEVIYISILIVIVNLFMLYSLSSGFFSGPIRYFLFIIFTQIYLVMLLLFVYFYAKFKKIDETHKELLYLIKNVRKK